LNINLKYVVLEDYKARMDFNGFYSLNLLLKELLEPPRAR